MWLISIAIFSLSARPKKICDDLPCFNLTSQHLDIERPSYKRTTWQSMRSDVARRDAARFDVKLTTDERRGVENAVDRTGVAIIRLKDALWCSQRELKHSVAGRVLFQNEPLHFWDRAGVEADPPHQGITETAPHVLSVPSSFRLKLETNSISGFCLKITIQTRLRK